MAEKLDKYDERLVEKLSENARKSTTQIARELRLAKETTHYRIKRLQDQGVIQGFHAIINASSFGNHYFQVLLQLHKATKEDESTIVEYLRSQDSCANVQLLNGEYDVSCLLIHSNPGDVRQFVTRFNKRFGTLISEKTIHLIIKSHNFPIKLLPNGQTSRDAFYHGAPGERELDEIDHHILKSLTLDARAKSTDIAKAAGCDPQVVRYRIRKLEKDNILVGYSSTVDMTRLGKEIKQVFIMLNDPRATAGIIEFFASTQTIVTAYQLLGTYDLSVEIYVDNDLHLKRIMDEFRKNFLEKYVRFEVVRVYKNYKTSWSPYS